MALAPFFDRVYSAIGGHLSVSRDDLTAALEGVTVGVSCGASASENERWIAELAVNLLARLYPRISIRAFDDTKVFLESIASAINPDIELRSEAPAEFTVAIGSPDGEATLFPSASGWVAHLNHRPTPSTGGPKNPYSAGAAAVLAAAELFRRVFLHAATEEDISVSLLNFDDSTGTDLALRSTPIGDVVFVAAGAVGNGALWAISRDLNLQGHVTVIDHECLELSNLQRYVLANMSDIGERKVDIAKRALEATRIDVEVAATTLENFADDHGGITAPTLCVSVDNVQTRRAAQALLPRLVLNGWTGEQALGASWHFFDRPTACLSCLYHPHRRGASQTEQAARALGLSEQRAAELWVTRIPLSEEDIATAATKLGVSREDLMPWRGKTLGDLYTDVVCGAVPIDLAVSHRTETVPLAHQSALAGLLMAAELIKRTDSVLQSLAQPEVLVTWETILQPPPKTWIMPRAREKGCICSDSDYQAAYATKWCR